MTLPRREFLHVAAGAAAVATLAESAIPTGAQPQPPGNGVLPKRSARDRLEEALARLPPLDPAGTCGHHAPTQALPPDRSTVPSHRPQLAARDQA